jgi:hypothetical protein
MEMAGYTDIMGYEILGESVNDLLEGEYGDDVLLGEDFELVGDELLLGLDDTDDIDLLGATDPSLVGQLPPAVMRVIERRRKAAGQPSIKAVQRRQRREKIAAAVAARQAAVVREKPPTESREYPMGFDTVGTVAAGANVQIISRPQVTFRPERLVIAGAIAPSFLLNDLKVGKNSQLVNSAALPGDAFAPTAFGVRLRMDTAQISMDVVLDVTNISAGALRFNAALFGKAVQ